MELQDNQEEVEAAMVAEGGEGTVEDPIFVTLDGLTEAQLLAAVTSRPNELVRAKDADGWTLLHHAVHRGWSAPFAIVFVYFWPESARQRSKATTGGGLLPIHLVNARTVSAVAAFVARLYPDGLSLPYEHEPNWPREPFHCAIKNGARFSVVVDLFNLRYGPDRETSPNDPLYLAGRPADDPIRVDGVKALSLAMQVNADVQVIRLVRGAWPNAIHDAHAASGSRWNPLRHAILAGAAHEVVRVLVQWRPEAIRERDDQGNLPIHYLFPTWYLRHNGATPEVEVARVLIEEWPESLLETNQAREVPLHRAVQSRSLPMVQLLVEHKPETLRVRDAAGSTPLHVAVAQAELSSVEIVEYLLARGSGALKVPDADGALPVQIAASSGAPLDALFLCVSKWPECVRRSAISAGEEVGDVALNNPRPRQRRRHY